MKKTDIHNPNLEESAEATARIAYPIAVSLKAAILRPIGFAYTRGQARIIIEELLQDPFQDANFASGTADGAYTQVSRIRKSWYPAINQKWGELFVCTEKKMRLHVSYWHVGPADQVRMKQLTQGPLRQPTVKQIPMDVGLFEAQDPDRNGWAIVVDE